MIIFLELGNSVSSVASGVIKQYFRYTSIAKFVRREIMNAVSHIYAECSM